jgi:ADP-ribosyl-[dinitrogen reductase] hydrolase
MPHLEPTRQDRVAGAFVGLAVGDALGTTLEFSRPGSCEPISDMVGGGPFSLAPGEWTDDTSMALCLAESLIARADVDLEDQARRYVRWWLEGHNAVTGHCFDIGNTVRSALERFRETGDPVAGDSSPHAAGNGALMRLAPAVLHFHAEPRRALDAAYLSTAVTHRAPQALAASDLFARMLLAALEGAPRQRILAAGADGCFAADAHVPAGSPYHPDVAAVARGERLDALDDYDGGGYVVDSLRVALHAFRACETFEDGALRAVNVGGDADTNGAIFGQIAGAFFGMRGIPDRWVARLAWRSHILSVAGKLA